MTQSKQRRRVGCVCLITGACLSRGCLSRNAGELLSRALLSRSQTGQLRSQRGVAEAGGSVRDSNNRKGID